MTRRRVAVTGIGAVTPVGHGADGLWAGVLANRSAVRRSTASTPRLPVAAGGPDRRLPGRRTTWTPNGRDGWTGSASSRWRPPAWRSSRRDGPMTPGTRIEPGSGSARRWGRGVRRGAACQLRAARRAGRGAHAGDRRLRRCRRVERVHRPRASVGRRSATRTRALPARWRSARRSTPSEPASWMRPWRVARRRRWRRSPSAHSP